MMKVRKMLTEILLDVTNSEIESVCKEVFHKAKNRAAKGSDDKTLKSLLLGYFIKGIDTCFVKFDLEILYNMCQRGQWVNFLNGNSYMCMYINKVKALNQKMKNNIHKVLSIRMLSLICFNKCISNAFSCICTIYIWARRNKNYQWSHEVFESCI